MSALTGTVPLVCLALRRDRIALPAWTLGLAVYAGTTTALWANQYRDAADLVPEVTMTASNAGIRMLGLASGASVGAYTMVRNLVLLAVLAALMSIFAVVRHTRQGEETARAELVGAAVVGRQSGLAAALVVTAGANAVLAVTLSLAMILAGQPAAGSLTAGAAVAAVGLGFTGVAAVTSQLASSTRGASGLAAAVLGVAFLLSGIGNMAGRVDPSGLRVESAWPTWLSPIGWAQQARPFGGDDWRPLALAVAALLAGAAAAALLAARRDFGHGILTQRRGPGRASRALCSPLGLAVRLQRGALIGWSVGLVGFGAVMGGLAGQVEQTTGSARDWYLELGGGGQILDAYRASVMQMAGAAAAVYTVQALLRMRTEEAAGQLEPILATGVSRARWVASHALAALLGATALMLLFAASMGLAAGAALGDPAGQVRAVIGAGLPQLPAIAAIGAGVVAATGLAPRVAVAASWAMLMASVLFGPLFGPTLAIPGWVRDLSPFSHVPRAPADPVTAGPILALVAVVAVLGLTGLYAIRRRDLALPA
ncbi:ABC transporter permease [Phytohabitans suffuscus]|uniref:Exporter of polyketide antibiotics n=1 Tax=Phytohabitans suffuscus TaxID=624315 RepID=A0A6F8YU75_9ACTN|nr:ABC antibiotics transporter [Phytohabitans suffuscus]BCB89664.1 exporter of polyketide antibiotics [Phytohabitans suffuscus]